VKTGCLTTLVAAAVGAIAGWFVGAEAPFFGSDGIVIFESLGAILGLFIGLVVGLVVAGSLAD
jgi:hypothetical protein